MSVQGEYRKLYGRFKFIVRIQDFASAGFETCSGVKMTTGKMTYREGGALVSYKEPALTEVEDLTLGRGICGDRDMWDWTVEVVNVPGKLPGGRGLVSPDFMRDLTIDQNDRDDSVAIMWHCYWCWPADYEASEWDNNAEEVAMENLVICYHHPDREDVA
jgi:phage tail-like protein